MISLIALSAKKVHVGMWDAHMHNRKGRVSAMEVRHVSASEVRYVYTVGSCMCSRKCHITYIIIYANCCYVLEPTLLDAVIAAFQSLGLD
jgi:hypothetical protein